MFFNICQRCQSPLTSHHWPAGWCPGGSNETFLDPNDVPTVPSMEAAKPVEEEKPKSSICPCNIARVDCDYHR